MLLFHTIFYYAYIWGCKTNESTLDKFKRSYPADMQNAELYDIPIHNDIAVMKR